MLRISLSCGRVPALYYVEAREAEGLGGGGDLARNGSR